MEYGDMFATSPPTTRRQSMTSQRPATDTEPRRYTRPVDASFGHRLATARNQAHGDALPTLSGEDWRAAGAMPASQVGESVRETTQLPLRVPPYGWERGSYRSPFEYNIPGHHVGANTNPASRPFPHTRPQSISFGSMPPIDTRTPPSMASRAATLQHKPEPICRAVTPGPDTKERLLLLGPLLVIQNTCATLCREDREMLHSFLDKYMGESLRTVVERDALLPQVIYKISIPMTDGNWQKYNQLLSVFAFANSMHKMLAVGSEEFDKYSFVVDAESGTGHVESWKALASARSRGLSMEMLLQELVQTWKKTWT